MAQIIIETFLPCPKCNTHLAFDFFASQNAGVAIYVCLAQCPVGKVTYQNGVVVFGSGVKSLTPIPNAVVLSYSDVTVRCPGGCAREIKFERSMAQALIDGGTVTRTLKAECGCTLGPVSMLELKARLKAELSK